MFGSFGAQITGRPLFNIVAPLTLNGAAQPGDSFSGYRYVSSLKTMGSDVIALDERGDIVAVRGHFDKGQALMVGSFPIREMDFAEDGLTRLVQDFADLAGIDRPAIIINRDGHEVEAKLLNGQGKTGLMVLLNGESDDFDFIVRLDRRIIKSALNLETGISVPFEIDNGHTYIRTTLSAADAAGIYFEG